MPTFIFLSEKLSFFRNAFFSNQFEIFIKSQEFFARKYFFKFSGTRMQEAIFF